MRTAQFVQWFFAKLLHGQQVGEDLCGVHLIGQAVPHRHLGVKRQLLNHALVKAAVLDAVVVAPQDAGGVLQRFLVAQLRAAGIQIGHVPALVVHRDLEGAAGARRRFLENQHDVFTRKARLFVAHGFRAFEFGGQVEQVAHLIGGEIL